MNILAIDTSTKHLSLAVARDGRIVRYRNRKLVRPLSSSIMPGIESILKSSGIALRQLDGFAVGLGPGSFTSLRVGLSTVKGLAFVVNKPVVGVGSLDILAMNVTQKGSVCVLLDAKRKMVYACIFEKNANGLMRKSGYMLAGIKDVLKKIKGSVVFIGDGVKMYKEDILAAKTIKPTFISEKHNQPQARCLVPLAVQLYKKGKVNPIDQVVPLYLYPDHCQVVKK